MYAFEIEVQSGYATRCALVLFSGQWEGTELDYGEQFQLLMANRHRPHDVVFIIPQYLVDALSSHIDCTSPFVANLLRFGSRTSVTIFSFGLSGTLRKEWPLRKSRKGTLPRVDQLKDAVVQGGITELAKRNKKEVLIEAPPGTQFMKPSGKTSDLFIQASGLARNYSEHQFLAFCLLGRLPRQTEVTKIYIDTGGIAAIAEAVCYYLYRFSGDLCKQTTYSTFSSYGGMESAKPDVVDNVWVIISASFSNDLGREVCASWGLRSDQVITLLTFADTKNDGKGGGAIVNIKGLSNFQEKASTKARVNLKITGENFTTEIVSPKAVMLKAVHRPTGLAEFLHSVCSGGVLSCRRNGGTRTRSIHLSFRNIISQGTSELGQNIVTWVDRALTWYAPRNVGWVLYDKNDTDHVELADMVQKRLRKLGYRRRIETRDIRNPLSGISGDFSVLILSPVISGWELSNEIESRTPSIGAQR